MLKKFKTIVTQWTNKIKIMLHKLTPLFNKLQKQTSIIKQSLSNWTQKGRQIRTQTLLSLPTLRMNLTKRTDAIFRSYKNKLQLMKRITGKWQKNMLKQYKKVSNKLKDWSKVTKQTSSKSTISKNRRSTKKTNSLKLW